MPKKQIITNKRINAKNIISFVFGIIFLTIAILNAFLIHRVPGVLYTLFSLIYFYPIDKVIKRFIGFSIPFIVKIILALVILWGTLAVGDLMEMFEAYLNK